MGDILFFDLECLECLQLVIFFLVNGFMIGQKLLFVDGFSVMDSFGKIWVYRVPDCFQLLSHLLLGAIYLFKVSLSLVLFLSSRFFLIFLMKFIRRTFMDIGKLIRNW